MFVLNASVSTIDRYAYDLTELKQYGSVSFVCFEGLEEKFIVGFSAHEANEAKKQLYFELPRKNK